MFQIVGSFLIYTFQAFTSLQGSIATSLRCDGIFNDQCVTWSLLSLKI